MVPSLRGVRSRVVGATALSVVLATGLAGCSLSGTTHTAPPPSPTLTPKPVATPSGTATATPAGLRRYYRQHLSWHACRTGDECARVTVPLDYQHPDGQSIRLAVLKVPAQDQAHKVGALVVNPGGPGGSGVDYAANASAYFGGPLRQNYDIVGFDPRGVGDSDPVQCLPDHQLDVFVASDPDPDTPAEIRHSDQLLAQFGNLPEGQRAAGRAHLHRGGRAGHGRAAGGAW